MWFGNKLISSFALLQVVSHKDKKAMEEAKEKLSTTLMVALPELISKACSNKSTILFVCVCLVH